MTPLCWDEIIRILTHFHSVQKGHIWPRGSSRVYSDHGDDTGHATSQQPVVGSSGTSTCSCSAAKYQIDWE